MILSFINVFYTLSVYIDDNIVKHEAIALAHLGPWHRYIQMLLHLTRSCVLR